VPDGLFTTKTSAPYPYSADSTIRAATPFWTLGGDCDDGATGVSASVGAEARGRDPLLMTRS
jgi:hypothetical protein